MRQSADLCSLCFSYAMDELTLFEQHRYAKHLKKCSACQTEYVELLQLRRQAEHEFVISRMDSVALYLHPFGRQMYWLAATAMVLVVGLTLPHHAQLVGRFAETASDVHHGLSIQLTDFTMFAHRLLRAHMIHSSIRSIEI